MKGFLMNKPKYLCPGDEMNRIDEDSRLDKKGFGLEDELIWG